MDRAAHVNVDGKELLSQKEVALTCLAWSKGCLVWQIISVDTNYEKWDGVEPGERGQTAGLPSFFFQQYYEYLYVS